MIEQIDIGNFDITGINGSEYISIMQDDDIINIECDRINFLISSLKRFSENTERSEV